MKYSNNQIPIQPSSGDSVVGVITSILIAANIVCQRTWLNEESCHHKKYHKIKE